MTAVYTVDIFCEFPGCHRWEHGSTGRGGANVDEARARAKRQGWRRRLVSFPGTGHRMKVDLCHAHCDFTPESLDAAFDKGP